MCSARMLFTPLVPISPIMDCRSRYHFGKTLGAGTYGIVREAEVDGQKVAVKIILKKNVKGNEQMVYDELKMLQKLNHPHIVRFHDWFESRVSKCDTYWAQFHSADTPQDKYYIVTQLATGGELFDRICDQGRFTEKDASQTIKQVLEAVDYLHQRNVVHRGLCMCQSCLGIADLFFPRPQARKSALPYPRSQLAT